MMQKRCSIWHRSWLAGLLVLLGSAGTSHAEVEIAQWDGQLQTSTKLHIIAAQLRGALKLQQAAMQQLSAPPSPETLEAAAKTIYDAYAHVRKAHAGILARISKTERFPDPLLKWQEQRVQNARGQLLAAMDQAKTAHRLKEYRRISKGVQHLQSSITFVEQVLDVMP